MAQNLCSGLMTYDTSKLLVKFNAQMRAEVDFNRLTTILCQTTQDTLEPHELLIWIAPFSGQGR